MDMLRRLRELVRFGYDVFISYSRSDGRLYAQALYLNLHKRRLAPFIDSVGTTPGQKTPAAVPLGGSALISAKIIADAAREARRAQIGTQLERDGAAAARLFDAGQMDGLLAAIKAASGLETLQNADTSFVNDLDNLPATSPI